jgi:hypothetical protein
MRWSLKPLLIWLVMLAIPAQGIAASTMLFCAISHHRTLPATDSGTGLAAHPLAEEDLSQVGVLDHVQAEMAGERRRGLMGAL